MRNQRHQSHGEGDPEAAERFNKAEKAVVKSARGKRAVRKGAKVRPEEEAALQDAEERGRQRARGDDSGEPFVKAPK